MISGRGVETEFILRINGNDVSAANAHLSAASSGIITNTINLHYIHEVPADSADTLEIILSGDQFELFSPSKGTTITLVQLR